MNSIAPAQHAESIEAVFVTDASTRETAALDLKSDFDPDSAGDWCELLKDIAAMANTTGGRIVVGLNDDGNPSGISLVKILAIDPAVFVDKVFSYTEVHFAGATVVAETLTKAPVAMLIVGETPSPLVFNKAGNYHHSSGKPKCAFTAGTLYVRHGAKSEPATSDDVRDIIDRRVKRERDALIATLQRVAEAPAGSVVTVSAPVVALGSDPSARPVRLVTDPSAAPATLLDPNTTHPHRQRDVVAGVNAYLRGSVFVKDHIHALAAVGLYERNWRAMEEELTDYKLRLRTNLLKYSSLRTDIMDCEVKSTWLRNPKERENRSPFLHGLTNEGRTYLAEMYYSQLAKYRMHLITVVIDKRHLRAETSSYFLHLKAYEILLGRIERLLSERYPKHGGLVVMDDSERDLNRAVAMKHAQLLHRGGQRIHFNHIAEYPFFTESSLSHGVQLADLCAYNAYRAFRNQEFTYPFFARFLRHYYNSGNTPPDKLDGLKVFPDDSPLVEWSRAAFADHLKTRDPPRRAGLGKVKPGWDDPYRADMQHPADSHSRPFFPEFKPQLHAPPPRPVVVTAI